MNKTLILNGSVQAKSGLVGPEFWTGPAVNVKGLDHTRSGLEPDFFLSIVFRYLRMGSFPSSIIVKKFA